jgi:hypothetical protein
MVVDRREGGGEELPLAPGAFTPYYESRDGRRAIWVAAIVVLVVVAVVAAAVYGLNWLSSHPMS